MDTSVENWRTECSKFLGEFVEMFKLTMCKNSTFSRVNFLGALKRQRKVSLFDVHVRLDSDTHWQQL